MTVKIQSPCIPVVTEIIDNRYHRSSNTGLFAYKKLDNPLDLFGLSDELRKYCHSDGLVDVFGDDIL